MSDDEILAELRAIRSALETLVEIAKRQPIPNVVRLDSETTYAIEQAARRRR